MNSTTHAEKDVSQSIIKFSRIMWTFVSNESIKRVLHTLILAAITFSESSISQIASLFGIPRQNSVLLAAYAKQKTFNGLELTLENLNEYVKNKKRVKRKDAMSDELAERASVFWENNCEVSPNMKDVCRHRVNGGPWLEHIKHFQYDTEAELLKKFIDTGEVIGVKNFHTCKPWFIYNGPMNTCVCVKCLNIQLIKESVVKNKKILRAPYQINFARRIIVNLLRANLMVARVRMICVQNSDDFRKLKILSIYSWFIIINALTQKSDVYKICEGKHKTDIAERLMCRGALPSFSECADKICGLPRCYGDCDKAKSCLKCLNLVKLHRDENMEREHWPPETRIKYKSYCSDPSGASKEESDLHEHSVHPSTFMLYFNAMTRKHCYHIAKVSYFTYLLFFISNIVNTFLTMFFR
jgi:hypothetical protein